MHAILFFSVKDDSFKIKEIKRVQDPGNKQPFYSHYTLREKSKVSIKLSKHIIGSYFNLFIREFSILYKMHVKIIYRDNLSICVMSKR